MTLETSSARLADRALSLVATDQGEAALREAITLCEHDPASAVGWFVLGAALRLQGQPEPARAAFSAAVRRATASSQLPLAIAAAVSLGGVGGDAAPRLSEIAQAFGLGSPLLAERRALPPELPGEDDPPAPPSVSADTGKLVLRAAKLVDLESERTSSAPKAKSLSPHPLFSSLPARELAEFAAIFEVLVLDQGTRVVEEGTVGAEAFVVARGELEVEKNSAVEGEGSLHLARLGTGALFGEMALLSRSPRAASVTAAVPSVVLVAAKGALDRVAERAPVVGQRFAEHCKRRMLENLLRTSQLFRSASAVERPALVERFGIRSFETGQKLARQGEPSEGLYLLASGQVSIFHNEGDGRTLVTHLGAGDIVGEVALILRRPAIADAVASHPSVTLFLPAARFLELVRSHPKVFADLYELAVSRDQEIQDIAQEEAIEGEDFVLV